MIQIQNKPRPKPFVLIILDGFGESEQTAHNAIKEANTPTLDELFRSYPHTLLKASGKAVGLPDGQMGNSEVGHLHIGSGRKVLQDLTRINMAIANGKFYENAALIEVVEKAKTLNKAVHILGLLSSGGVHSRDNQIAAMIELAHRRGAKKIYLHAILDGRDTPPKSALFSIEKIAARFNDYDSGKIVSLIGRYYAMDRDQRWDRTEKAYNLLTQGTAQFHASTAKEALRLAYEQGQTDEFVNPISIRHDDEALITIEDDDVVIFMNFRGDRARQFTYAFTDDHFTAFKRKSRPKLSAFATLTTYAKDLKATVAFPPLQLQNTLGEYLSTLGYQQLRITETEKYAHVTYFLNGRQEVPFYGEDRLLIPSPPVATYDLQPEMSSNEITDKLVKAIKKEYYDFIVCNFANPDMVGHTGNEIATRKAIQNVDHCLKRIMAALQFVGGEALITADHGNAEKMFDKKINQPHTAHTSNLVPCIYVGRSAQFQKKIGALDDVAPTLLYLMSLEKPKEMTGCNLITLT